MNTNAETFRDLRTYVDDLRKGVLQPLEKVQKEYIPLDLKTSVEELARCLPQLFFCRSIELTLRRDLEALMQPWKARYQRKTFKLVSRFITAKKDKADLADTANQIRAAVVKFMVNYVSRV